MPEPVLRLSIYHAQENVVGIATNHNDFWLLVYLWILWLGKSDVARNKDLGNYKIKGALTSGLQVAHNW